MLSLLFGITAALCWGVHDVCVRSVAARSGPALSFLVVLASGTLFLLPLALFHGGWGAVGLANGTLGLLSGLLYAAGGYSLYRAFEIGPVRLVAPLIGTYPVLSLLWAAFQGTPPSLPQAFAVLAIVIGVGLNAALSDHGDGTHADRATRLKAAILWSLAGCTGFALTFAVGQAASLQGGGLALILISRLGAFIGLLAAALTLRAPLPLRGAPYPLLAIMGLCDATALGLVQIAGTLPRPEFAAVASSTFGMITVLLAWAFLKEKMSPPQWGAVALVFAGIGYLAL